MEDIRELAWKGNLPALRHLVESMGVDVNDAHKMNGTTPLHWAINGGYSNTVSYLVGKGADLNRKDNKGVSPIDLAAKAPNSIRAALGLPPIDQPTEKLPKDKDGLVASLAFAPLPSTTLPLPPLVESRPIFVPPTSAPASTSPQAAPSVTAPVASTTLVRPPVVQSVTEPTIFIKLKGDQDVVELDLPIAGLAKLKVNIGDDLNLPLERIVKIRKLPNILIVKDRDVDRLKNGDVLEIETKE